MQPFFTLRLCALLTLLMAIMPASFAQTLYWDTSNAPANRQSWRTTDTWWSTSPTGGNLQVWTQGATAVFSAGIHNPAEHSLVDVGQGVKVGSIVVEEGDVRLSGFFYGGHFLDVSTFYVAPGASAILDTTLAQTGGAAGTPVNFTKTGAGSLNLVGPNDTTGSTFVSGGTLTINSVGNLGAGNLTVNNGASLAGLGNLQFNANKIVHVTGANSTMSTPGYLEVGQASNASLTIENGGSVSSTTTTGLGIVGGVTGTGLVTGSGSTLNIGTDLLLGFQGTGNLTVSNSGRVQVDRRAYLGHTGGVGNLDLASGGTLAVGNTDGIRFGTGTGTLTLSGGTIEVIGIALTTSVPATLSSGTTSNINTNGLGATFSGTLSGPGNLAKTGAGTLTLPNANTYTGGTIINGGTLTIGHIESLGAPGGYLTLGGGTLDLGTFSPTFGTVIFDGGTFTNGTLENTSAWLVRNASVVPYDLGGSGGLTKSGSNSTTLTGDNSYTGGTTVSSGTLVLGSATALGTNPSINLASGATLDVNGYSLTVPSLNGTGNLALGSVEWIIGDANDHSLTGIISGTEGSLVKTGAGTFTLGGANTYTGGTTINAGTLAVASAGNLGSGAVAIAGGGLESTGNLGFDRSVTVAGSASTLDTDGYIEFGSVGTGALAVTTGGKVSSGTSTAFGVLAGSVGTGTVSGAGSRLDVGSTLFLGYLGSGTLDIASGGVVSANNLNMATGANSSATVNLNPGGNLVIGGANAITRGSGTSQFNLAGGQLTSAEEALTTSVPIHALAETTSTLSSIVDMTLSGNLSGTGTLHKHGNGTLILNTPNDYSGTIVSYGGWITLEHGDALQNAILHNPYPTTVTAPYWPASRLNFGSLTEASFGGLGGMAGLHLENAASQPVALTIGGNDTSSTHAGIVTGSGSIIKTGSGNFNLSPQFIGDANTYSGGTTILEGTLSITHGHNLGTGPVLISGGTLQGINLGMILNNHVTVDGTSSFLSSAAIHSGGNVVGSLSVTNGGQVSAEQFITFGHWGGHSTALITGEGSRLFTPSYIQVTNGAMTVADGGTVSTVDLNLNANTLNLNDGGTIETNGNITGTAPINFAGGAIRTFVPNRSVQAPLALATDSTSTIDTNEFNYTVANVISGEGSLTKTGAGNLILNVANTHSGFTTISEGTLVLGHADALANSTLTTATGLSFGSLTAANLGGLSGSQNLALINASASPVALGVGGNNGSTTFSGILSGSGSLAKAGTGSLTLTGTHTHIGGTTIHNGALRLGNGGTSGTVPGDIVNNGTLIFNRSGDRTYDGVISGSGTVVNDGYILRFSNPQTYTGPTVINSGYLVLPTDANQGLAASTTVHVADGSFFDFSNRAQTIAGLTGSGTVYSFGGNGGLLTVDTAVGQEDTFSGNMGGIYPHLALTKAGEGTLILSGVTPYTGTTTISQGSLVLPNGLPQNGGLVTVDEAGSLSLGANGVRALTNNGSVVNTGGDTLTLSGDLRGNGLFTGDFLWSATTRPGNSTGILQIDGDLTFANTHTLEAEIGGTVPGSEMDQVAVSGTLTLGGTLKVSLVNDFVPAKGDTFSLFTAETFNGEISTLDLSDAVLPEGLFWDTQNLSTNGTLSVISINFELWADLLGLDADPMADLQGDGFPLLVKYALGLDPGIPASASDKPVFSLNQTGEDTFLRLTVNRTVVRSDVLIVGEVTNDLLGTWSDAGVDLIEETPEQLIFQDTIPLKDLSLRFMRIRFMLDTPNP